VPPLSESIMVEATKARFRAFNVTLPTVVSTTPPNISQFLVQSRQNIASAIGPKPIGAISIGGATGANLRVGGGTTPVRLTGVPQNVPPALIKAASNDKVDVDFQTQVNNELSNYITAICHTIVGAHDNWRFTAHLTGVKVMAITAIGGSITGPLLSVNMNMYGPQQGLWGNAGAYTRAIADGLASCWRDWERSVNVPSLPWYPAFAAFPSASAPPLPNVPTPLAMMAMSPTALTPDTIKQTIARKLAQPGAYSDELFTSIAAGFVAAVAIWLPLQPVAKVMGRGPIPSFAPPYVPVGPVVNGDIIEASPHFDL
jgi:hypothetical protein